MNLNTVKKNLEGKGYKVSCCETASKATDYICSEIKGTSVGFGGSITVKEMGLYEKLAENNEVVWHWVVPEGKNAGEIRKLARETEVYIASVNGLAETGEIINIDGSGNRLAETMFGHKKVIFVVGSNKIAPDFDKALFRARNIAAPLNAKRLGLKTPCAERGDRCYDCSSPARICCAFSVFTTKPKGSEYEIVLVDENLGY